MADDENISCAEIARLGRLTDGVSLLIREGQPYYRSWQNSAGETLAICKYENGRMTCISKVESEKVLKCICVLDSDVPMLKRSDRKICPAYLPKENSDVASRFRE